MLPAELTILKVSTPHSASYPVYLGKELERPFLMLLSDHFASGAKVLVLMDTNTQKHCLPTLNGWLQGQTTADIVIPAGEQHKTIETATFVWKEMLRLGADRGAVLVCLGGGVVSDLGGFCASTFMRGISVVHIPTTLLAQVDASVGGKTGIDLDGVKNMVGIFKNPEAVFVCPEFLKTLPERELRAGFAEMLKHGLIADESHWQHLCRTDLTLPEYVDWTELIAKSISIKKKIVESDPFEKGERKVLNFGHTVAHAIEGFALGKPFELLHGEAVALGMIAEARLSAQLLGLSASDAQLIERVILAKVLAPIRPILAELKTNWDSQAILKLMLHDKKNESGSIKMALISEIGKATPEHIVTTEQALDTLENLRSFL